MMLPPAAPLPIPPLPGAAPVAPPAIPPAMPGAPMGLPPAMPPVAPPVIPPPVALPPPMPIKPTFAVPEDRARGGVPVPVAAQAQKIYKQDARHEEQKQKQATPISEGMKKKPGWGGGQ